MIIQPCVSCVSCFALKCLSVARKPEPRLQISACKTKKTHQLSFPSQTIPNCIRLLLVSFAVTLNHR